VNTDYQSKTEHYKVDDVSHEQVLDATVLEPPQLVQCYARCSTWPDRSEQRRHQANVTDTCATSLSRAGGQYPTSGTQGPATYCYPNCWDRPSASRLFKNAQILVRNSFLVTVDPGVKQNWIQTDESQFVNISVQKTDIYIQIRNT